MGMSKSGAETAEELKLSSLKHALHPSVLEEAMPRIAGPERLAETLTSRRHISLSRCRRLALSFSAVPEAQRGSGFSLCRPLHDSSCLLDDLLVIYNAPKPLTGIGSINVWEGELTVMPLSSPLDQDGPVEHVSLIMVIHAVHGMFMILLKQPLKNAPAIITATQHAIPLPLPFSSLAHLCN